MSLPLAQAVSKKMNNAVDLHHHHHATNIAKPIPVGIPPYVPVHEEEEEGSSYDAPAYIHPSPVLSSILPDAFYTIRATDGSPSLDPNKLLNSATKLKELLLSDSATKLKELLVLVVKNLQMYVDREEKKVFLDPNMECKKIKLGEVKFHEAAVHSKGNPKSIQISIEGASMQCTKKQSSSKLREAPPVFINKFYYTLEGNLMINESGRLIVEPIEFNYGFHSKSKNTSGFYHSGPFSSAGPYTPEKPHVEFLLSLVNQVVGNIQRLEGEE